MPNFLCDFLLLGLHVLQHTAKSQRKINTAWGIVQEFVWSKLVQFSKKILAPYSGGVLNQFFQYFWILYINLPVLMVKREPHCGHLGVVIRTIPPRVWVKLLPQRKHLRFWISVSIFFRFIYKECRYNYRGSYCSSVLADP